MFHPKKFRKNVSEMGIVFYVGAIIGEHWFDNVKVEAISVEQYEKER
jgi:uncharacterized protein with ATP-grasp and redox domains